MEKTLNLSGIDGMARLYATLVQDGAERRDVSDLLYRCRLANLSACGLPDMELWTPQSFAYALISAHAAPYRTDVQTIKALALLERNTDADGFHEVTREIGLLKDQFAQRFYDEYGYTYSDPVTSFSLCEDTLDPAFEPKEEFDPGSLFRRISKSPKFVYVSAPLRGNVEKNIEFATEKAQEVFDEGNIPICPHLMFPPIADPHDPGDDKAAMWMCLKLIERCDELRVYGPEWTEGMWQEIQHAERMKIPVLTDQERVPRSKTVKKSKTTPCR